TEVMDLIKRIIPLLFACTLMLGLGAYWLLYFTGNNTEYAKGHRYLVTIKPGMTTADIADLLHKKHLVKTPEAFRMEARIRGLAGKLEAGRYEIVGGMSNSEIVDILSKGQTYNVKFTVPEGFNVVKTGRKLEAEGLGEARKFEEAARNYTPYPYMETNNSDVIFKAEGFIFPTTYQLEADMSEKEILALMVRNFNSEMNREKIPALAEEKKMKLRDLINLAAMVELEAVYPEEQARIAGVFLKRLHIYMPIQSDTTIQYLLGAQKEEVTIADTKIKSPYNTYQNPGLPPGPIGSPGMDAIKAVLNPEATDYLYFVAEKDGHHRFTKTYQEHLKAIEEIHSKD
ncbi:MAG: endolytic transglycosylase MltG, partial [Acidaminococcaceae bacterium]|nr:endolytic transglycosylase MltG [Acidaminococcaceae bacterium]